MVGWLVGWLAGVVVWLVGRLVGLLVGSGRTRLGRVLTQSVNPSRVE